MYHLGISVHIDCITHHRTPTQWFHAALMQFYHSLAEILTSSDSSRKLFHNILKIAVDAIRADRYLSSNTRERFGSSLGPGPLYIAALAFGLQEYRHEPNNGQGAYCMEAMNIRRFFTDGSQDGLYPNAWNEAVSSIFERLDRHRHISDSRLITDGGLYDEVFLGFVVSGLTGAPYEQGVDLQWLINEIDRLFSEY